MDEQVEEVRGGMAECRTFEQVMEAARIAPEEGAIEAKVNLIELAAEGESYLAFTIAGEERVKVAEFLFGSLDRLFEAMEQAKQLREAQGTKIVLSSPE